MFDDHLCERTSETGCSSPMHSLSMHICGTDPPSCGALTNYPGTFIYMGNRWVGNPAGGCGMLVGTGAPKAIPTTAPHGSFASKR